MSTHDDSQLGFPVRRPFRPRLLLAALVLLVGGGLLVCFYPSARDYLLVDDFGDY